MDPEQGEFRTPFPPAHLPDTPASAPLTARLLPYSRPQMPFANTSESAAMYDYIRDAWPFWRRTVAANQTRHIIALTCDHGPGCGGRMPQPTPLPHTSRHTLAAAVCFLRR